MRARSHGCRSTIVSTRDGTGIRRPVSRPKSHLIGARPTVSDSSKRLIANYAIWKAERHSRLPNAAVELSPEPHFMSSPSAGEYVRGALFGFAAVSIWSGWIVASRFGLKTSLTPWDITAIRFAVAGMIVLPYLLRKGLAFDLPGWTGLAAILLGGGAPMVLVANAGLLFSPAAHADALFPGVMPLQVAILAKLVIGEALSWAKRIGFVLIRTGAAVGALLTYVPLYGFFAGLSLVTGANHLPPNQSRSLPGRPASGCGSRATGGIPCERSLSESKSTRKNCVSWG
jgi:EamA-like transporter family